MAGLVPAFHAFLHGSLDRANAKPISTDQFSNANHLLGKLHAFPPPPKRGRSARRSRMFPTSTILERPNSGTPEFGEASGGGQSLRIRTYRRDPHPNPPPFRHRR